MTNQSTVSYLRQICTSKWQSLSRMPNTAFFLLLCKFTKIWTGCLAKMKMWWKPWKSMACLLTFVRDLGSKRNNYELIIILQNSHNSVYIKKQLLLPYNFCRDPTSRSDWNSVWVIDGFRPFEILTSGIIVASLLGKERNSSLIVKTWVWVSWVELDSLTPIFSVSVGLSLNLLVVHKWCSSSHGSLALKSESYSWYQWDGAAVITRVISFFRGQLCSGLCLFMCHSKKWSRQCHCCCWCIRYCYCSYDFLFPSAEKMPKQATSFFI